MDKVQVTDTKAKPDPTLEEQLAAQQAAGRDFDSTARAAKEAGDGANAKPTEGTPNQRPDWLPEKFKTVEDMAKAYAELEKKQGSPANDDDKAKPTDDTKPAEGTIESAIKAATEQFEKDGKLAPETYDALQKAGISRDYVDAYIAGQEVLGTKQVTDLHNSVGGKEAYEAMTNWMTETLGDDELDAFNSTIEGGNVGAIKLAVQGMAARHAAATGKGSTREPKLEDGDSGSTPRGAEPYSSYAEVRKDMSTKEYRDSPAFRAKVAQRLAVSKL